MIRKKFKVDRNMITLYETLTIFNNSLNYNDKIIDKKLNNLIEYLEYKIFPKYPKDYDIIDEKIYIINYLEK